MQKMANELKQSGGESTALGNLVDCFLQKLRGERAELRQLKQQHRASMATAANRMHEQSMELHVSQDATALLQTQQQASNLRQTQALQVQQHASDQRQMQALLVQQHASDQRQTQALQVQQQASDQRQTQALQVQAQQQLMMQMMQQGVGSQEIQMMMRQGQVLGPTATAMSQVNQHTLVVDPQQIEVAMQLNREHSNMSVGAAVSQ